MSDDDKWRLGRIPDILSYEERAGTSTTGHQRIGSKIGTPTMRENVRKRVDVGAEIICAKLAVAQLTKGEWECWIGLREGVLFDPLPKGARARRNWHVIAPPAKSATVEQVARHYGYTEASVRRMEQQARKTLHAIRERAGLTYEIPRVPIWPAICTDENLLRYLFGRED